MPSFEEAKFQKAQRLRRNAHEVRHWTKNDGLEVEMRHLLANIAEGVALLLEGTKKGKKPDAEG